MSDFFKKETLFVLSIEPNEPFPYRVRMRWRDKIIYHRGPSISLGNWIEKSGLVEGQDYEEAVIDNAYVLSFRNESTARKLSAFAPFA